MSSEYCVIVPRGHWPSYRALNEAFERQGFPVEIVKPYKPLSGDPVVTDAGTLGLAMRLEGQPVELEADVETLLDSTGLNDVNLDLAQSGSRHRASDGDTMLTVMLRSSLEEWTAGCYLMAALVREFAGYGFDDGGSYGDQDWADQLVRGAECQFQYEDEASPAPAQVAAAGAAARQPLGLSNMVSMARWIVIALVIGYFAISSWWKAETALDRQEAAQEAQR